MIIALTIAWIAVLVLCWLGWQLLRQNGRILLRLEALEQRLNELEFGGSEAPEGLPIGSVAPEFDLPDLAGQRRTLVQCRAQPLLLIFFNPDCGFCRDLAAKLAALPQNSRPVPGGKPSLVILSTGGAEMNRRFFREQKIACPVLLQKHMEVAKAYQADGTPTGYLINGEGKIASKLTIGGEALLALADGNCQERLPAPEAGEARQGKADSDRASRFGSRALVRSRIPRDGLKAGTTAPRFRLPRLDGGELALEDLRGSRVLLVFSDPHCGPCDALAPRLEQLHQAHPEIRVVMISRGEPGENRAKVRELKLTFPVVLQQHWEISRRYAMFATPIAYLIDEAGVIAHEVAAGEDAILKLLSGAPREKPIPHGNAGS